MISKNSINKVILVGHVGQDPDIIYTTSGHSIATSSLATNEIWMYADKKQRVHTELHNIVAWNKLADFVKQYVVKGQLLYLEGRIHSQTWVDKNNIRQNKKEIICDNITPLEWKNKS